MFIIYYNNFIICYLIVLIINYKISVFKISIYNTIYISYALNLTLTNNFYLIFIQIMLIRLFLEKHKENDKIKHNGIIQNRPVFY